MSQNYRLTQNIIKSLSKVVDDYGAEYANWAKGVAKGNSLIDSIS